MKCPLGEAEGPELVHRYDGYLQAEASLNNISASKHHSSDRAVGEESKERMTPFANHIPLKVSIFLLANATLLTAQLGPRPIARAIKQPQPVVVVNNEAKINFDPTPASQISFYPLIMHVKAGQHLKINWADGTNFKEAHQCDSSQEDETDCLIIFAFMAPRDATDSTSFLDTATVFTLADSQVEVSTKVTLTGGTPIPTPTPANSTTICRPPDNNWFPTVRSSLLSPSKAYPPGSEDLAVRAAKQFGRNLWGEQKEAVINCYYQTNDQLAFFTQVKSIYNAMSSSTTVAANIGSYNFNNGMQLSLGTNIQAGPAGPTPTVVAGQSVPTLTATGAAQAAQNLFYGGNVYVYDDFPILIKKASGSIRWHFVNDILAREGVDIQSFNGTTTTATSPTTHFNFFDEAYWQYDADPATGSQTAPLAIFLGGQYGYAYTSVRYAQQYGFLNKSNAQVGAISFGVLVTGQFNVTVLREFGPSQKFIDSSTGKLGVVNNFKSWSFGVQYQTKGISSSK